MRSTTAMKSARRTVSTPTRCSSRTCRETKGAVPASQRGLLSSICRATIRRHSTLSTMSSSSITRVPSRPELLIKKSTKVGFSLKTRLLRSEGSSQMLPTLHRLLTLRGRTSSGSSIIMFTQICIRQVRRVRVFRVFPG